MAKAMLATLLIPIVLWCYGVRGRPLHLPLKTIKTAEGDVFDCLDIYKQPAFDHPLLKDHKILMKPTVTFKNSPEVRVDWTSNHTHGLAGAEPEGGGCPEGTVPVHRLPRTNFTSAATPSDLGHESGKRYEVALRKASLRPYYGGSARISVYGLEQTGEGQQSSSMIWLWDLDADVPTRGVVRAGWVVAPDKYYDSKTRQVIAFSADGDEHICYNLECPGFVQVNPKVLLGSTISPLSVYEKEQYYIYCHIFMDDKMNWWFALGDYSNVVGYWPAKLFANMDHVSLVEFGGVVSCRQNQNCPPMGAGRKDGSGCAIRYIQVVGPDHRWGGLSFWKQHKKMSNPNCYVVWTYDTDTHGYQFEFGGAGCLP